MPQKLTLLLLVVALLSACNLKMISPRTIGLPPGALGPAPSVTSISPSVWGVKGGTTITVDGQFFDSAAIVALGGSACSNVTVVSASQITCDIPYHPAQVVDVVVTNPDGQTGVLAGGFKYNSFLYVTTQGGATLYGYTIDSGTNAVTSIGSYAAQAGAYQMVVDPTNTFLYSACTSNKIVGYTIDSGTGGLTQIAGSPFAAGTTANGIAITPDGTKLYSSNFGGANLSGFSVNTSTGALISVGTTAAGTQPGAMTIDSTGTFLYVTNYGSANISGYRINADATLTALSGSPYSQAGCTGPDGIAIHPTGAYLYAGCAQGTYSVGAWSVNSSTGALSGIGTIGLVDNATGGSGVTVDSTGSYLYATAFATGSVRGYSINSDGTLTALSSNQYLAQVGTNWVVIQTLGARVAAANTTSNSVTFFSRNTQTGALSLLQNFAIGATPGTIFLTN